MNLTCASLLQIQVEEIGHLPVIVFKVFPAHQMKAGVFERYQFLLRLERIIDAVRQAPQSSPILAPNKQNTPV